MFKRKSKKIFVIGRNKTGTTSIGEALQAAGYKLGDQSRAEKLMESWALRDFRPIIDLCKTAEVFQDVPFSLPYTYPVLDYHFPGSKFILMVRDSPEQWYESLVRFHGKIVGTDSVPAAQDLKAFNYVSDGWLWRQQQLVYGATEDTLYDRENYINHYLNYNNDVQEYFRFRPTDLLVLNLSQQDASKRLANFLEIDETRVSIKHLNKT